MHLSNQLMKPQWQVYVAKKIIRPFLILKILSLKSQLEIIIQTYDAIFYQRKLQKDATLMKMIWDLKQTKEMLIKIQTYRLFEKKMRLITLTNYLMLFGKRANQRILKLCFVLL